MKIAVNTRLLLKNKLEGIGWFEYETLSRLAISHPEVSFVFIFDRQPDPSFQFSDNVELMWTSPPARHPILFILFFEFSLPRLLKKIKPDIFLSPDGYLSLKTDVKSLPVIHDLNFETYPEHLSFLVRKYYRFYFPRFAKKACRIATVSNYTKKDISEKYGVDERIIDVVYNGVNPKFRVHSANEIQQVRNKFSDGKPYFLFVSLIHPRKNLLNQVKAFARFKSQAKSEFKYLVVGAKYLWEAEIDRVIEEANLQEEVIFLGRQDMDVLVSLYGAAFALTYVSYFEGFGIPLIEAMKSGIPFITSNKTSMPEIAGDSGEIVNPYSVSEIADAMKKLSEDNYYRDRKIEKGFKQASKFSWDQTANLLWSSIEKALQQEN